MILNARQQADLIWFCRWSETDLGGMRSGQASIEAQLDLRMYLRHPRTVHLAGPLECHPTPSWTDHDQAHDEMLRRIGDVGKERWVRAAWLGCPEKTQQLLFLAFVAKEAVRPEVVAPMWSARGRFGPWRLLADLTPEAREAHRREEQRAHRRVDLTAFLDKLGGAPKVHPEHELDVRRIALGCERLASAAGDEYYRALMRAPAPRRAA
jgi:hypothetical protein